MDSPQRVEAPTGGVRGFRAPSLDSQLCLLAVRLFSKLRFFIYAVGISMPASSRAGPKGRVNLAGRTWAMVFSVK